MHRRICFLLIFFIGFSNLVAAENIFLKQFNEIQTFTKPDWLEPGLRVTYEVSSFLIDLDNYSPDLLTGHMSVSEEMLHNFEYLIMQYDLCAQINDIFFNNITTYFSDQNGDLSPSNVYAVDDLAAAGKFWLAPEVINYLENTATEANILRTTATLGEEDIPVILIIYEYPTRDLFYILEAETGLVLRFAEAIVQQDNKTVLLRTENILGLRKKYVPWTMFTSPLNTNDFFNYKGKAVLIKDDIVVSTSDYGLSLKVIAKEDNYAIYEKKLYYNELADEPVQIIDSSQNQGQNYWLPPEFLSSLKKDQVIDTDPITGEVVHISDIGLLSDTELETVIIETYGNAYSNTTAYDLKTGQAVYFQNERKTNASLIVENALLNEFDLSDSDTEH